MPARISPTGTVLHGFNLLGTTSVSLENDDIYEMVQEDIVLERFETSSGATFFSRAYPSSLANDVLKISDIGDGAFVNTSTGDLLKYDLRGAVKLSDDSVFFANPNAHDILIGVMPDGGLLYADCLDDLSCSLSVTGRSPFFSQYKWRMIYVSPTFKETVLDLPEENFRIYIDRIKISSGQIAWLAVSIDGDEHRWRINLENNTVLDEGVFSVMLPGLSRYFQTGGDVLDGDGALWGGAYSSGLDTRVVYKRPIASSGQATVVVYEQPVVPTTGLARYVWNADFTFPEVKGTVLVTGQ
jgi:hypothetical protein